MTKSAKERRAPAGQHIMMPELFSRITVIGLLGVVIFIFVMTSACMNIQMRIGKRPDTDALERTLHPGESTHTEVLRALGEPHGKGKAMLPMHSSPKAMWSYYYEEGSLKDSRRIFLFVFFDQDRYDGYMWFSSLLK
jgi:hypothetical protein